MRKTSLIIVGIVVGVVLSAQQSGTPSQIRVITDATGALMISAAAQTLPLSQPTLFVNTRLRTDASGNLVVVTSGGSGAPADATYITQTPNSSLSAEQALSALSTGLMFSTTTTGVVSTLAPTDDSVVVGNGTVYQVKTLTACNGSADALTYNTSTNAFGCHALGGIAAGNTTQIQYNAGSSAFGASTRLTYSESGSTSNTLLVGGSGVDQSRIVMDSNSSGGSEVQFADGGTTQYKFQRDSGSLEMRLYDAIADVYVWRVTRSSGAVLYGATQTIPHYLDNSTPTSITSTSANSCGTTSPTFSTGSNNSRGSFNVGATSGTDCSLTFSTAAAHFWACSGSNNTTGNLVRGVESSTTVTKFQGVFGAADKVSYICYPY